MSDRIAIVSPAQLSGFAKDLQASIGKVHHDGNRFKQVVRDANVVWKDEKYKAFRREMEECVEELNQCVKIGNKYAEFLEEKALLARRYLDRR
jgi:uncharacterized protein YukE